MRKSITLLAFFLGFAMPAAAQLMHFVPVQAGTPEGNAVRDINAATDPAQKLALIDKFQTDLGSGNGAILANELYISFYMDAKNYDKVAEYAEKQLALDPHNFYAADSLFRAEDQRHDAAKLIETGERAGAIIAQYKTEQPPAGADAGGWAAQHQQGLADQHDEIDYIQRAMLQAIYQTQAPAEKAALAERFVAALPGLALRRIFRKSCGRDLFAVARQSENDRRSRKGAHNRSKFREHADSARGLLQLEWKRAG